MKTVVTFLVLMLLSVSPLTAQELIDDFFRSTGKINTVLGVVVLLFVVLIAYLIRLEKKISKIEKQFNDE